MTEPKLTPALGYHRQLLDDFLKQFWEFYHQLKAYRSQPSQQQAALPNQEFDTLFSTTAGYHQLDKRIAMTKAKPWWPPLRNWASVSTTISLTVSPRFMPYPALLNSSSSVPLVVDP